MGSARLTRVLTLPGDSSTVGVFPVRVWVLDKFRVLFPKGPIPVSPTSFPRLYIQNTAEETKGGSKLAGVLILFCNGFSRKLPRSGLVKELLPVGPILCAKTTVSRHKGAKLVS